MYALTTLPADIEPSMTYTSVQERESHRDNQVYASHTPDTGGEETRVIETIKCMLLTTHQLQVERRESHRAIKWMGIIGGHD